MTPLLAALLAVTAAALLAAVIAIVLATRRHQRSGDLDGVIRQIDAVRGEVEDLSRLFLVPRQRGVVGETILGELLAAWLPESAYELQYGFANGTRVDAVVRLGSRLVPVDSKFPLEAVQRFLREEEQADAETRSLPADLRKSFRAHIQDIADRYINPAEGTLGFALMYIPSERVYVELFAGRNEELMRLALEQNVVPVSPATLFLYLQTVAYGLRGLAIPEHARRLMDNLTALQGELDRLVKGFELAGTHLRNLGRVFDETGSQLERVRIRVDRITQERPDE